MAQVVEHLPTLGSIPNTKTNKVEKPEWLYGNAFTPT
jgi:hypothetical protein